STQQVTVVNQAFVLRFLESRDPIGFHFELNSQQREIVGVVADTKYDDLRKEESPTAYIPMKNGEVTFALRSAATPSALIPGVRRIVSEVDNNLPVFDVRTQSQTIDRLLFRERLLARLSSLFGLLARSEERRVGKECRSRVLR